MSPQPLTLEPPIDKDFIESATNDVLLRYARRQSLVRPPVPLEDILEIDCGLSLNFDDLEQRLGIPDVLGATFVTRREVFIDQMLEPTEHPKLEGRYRFTLAHELGHWILHRASAQMPGGGLATDEGRVICRSQVRDRTEREADYFASCVLMPRGMVLAAWTAQYGDRQPWSIEESARPEELKEVYEARAVPLAREFGTSAIAMRIRLEDIGLFRRRRPI